MTMYDVGLPWLPMRITHPGLQDVHHLLAQLWAIVEDVVILYVGIPRCQLQPGGRHGHCRGLLLLVALHPGILVVDFAPYCIITDLEASFTPSNFGGLNLLYTQRDIFSGGPLYCMDYF